MASHGLQSHGGFILPAEQTCRQGGGKNDGNAATIIVTGNSRLNDAFGQEEDVQARVA
jgi:hypothetical protein